MYFLSTCYMILKKNMLAYIYAFLFILFQQSPHTISLERGLFIMYYLLDETQEAYISYMHVFNLQRFERERVYTRDNYMHVFNLQRFERERVYTRDNYLINVCTFLPSIFMTGVHPPSPHPKFPMWQKTDNDWESTRRVTTPLTLDLLNQKEKNKYN